MADEDKIVEVYERMLALPESQREAFLQQELLDDDARELVEMLYKHEQAQAEGGSDAGVGDDSGEHADRTALLGSTIGPYQLTQILGRGGSATVYLAERIDQRYSAQVAIKVLDHVQERVAPREQSEWQILADLTHPDIARILDAGELADGRPYFIMEYVQGIPIDQHCDSERLGLADRLKLFLRVCAAVQFAHQRLVIHRDLKPLNILISPEGAPKLLDFGIATLLGASGHARTGAFAAGDPPKWTAPFASPEQMRGEPLTTASDVYALGVILYGLLTGLPPYEANSELQTEESALHAKPQVPSAAVMQAYATPQLRDITQRLAGARRLSARALARCLEGDLTAILLTALSQEVSARYSSVEQLAADLRRYLNHEVVQARGGTWFYVAGRFVRRHHLSVAAAVVAAAVLLTGAAALLVQNKRIRAEHARAERVSEFMLNVFSASDPFVSHGKQMTAGELLDQAGRRILSDPTLQDSVRADLLLGIGRAYRRQDLSEESLPYLTEALRLRTAVLPSEPLQLATVYAELALAYRSVGRLEDSEAAFQSALQASASQSDARSPAQVRLLTEIGRLEIIKGELDQAQRHFAEALELARRLFGAQHAEVASIQLDRANVAFLRDDYGNAVRWAEEAVVLNEQLLPPKHPDRVMSQYILASILTQSGDVHRAQQLFEKVLPVQRQLYGRASPKVADTLDALSVVHRRQRHLQVAERYAREALQIQQQAQSADHYMVGYFHVQLALALFDEGRNAQAHEQLSQALAIYEKTLPEDHEFRAAAEHWLGEVALAQGQLDIAAQALESAIGRWQRTGAPAWRVARSQNTLGVVVGTRGDCKRAEALLRQSVEAMAKDVRADPQDLDKARQRQKQFTCPRASSRSTASSQNKPGRR